MKRYTWANISLLLFLGTALLTGGLGLVNGSEKARWLLWLHGIAGYSTGAVLLWKGAIIFHALRRRGKAYISRQAFVLLMFLLVATLGTGVLWVFAGRWILSGYSLLTVHTVLGISLLGLLCYHVFFMRWVFGVPHAVGRRTFLRLTGTALGGLVLFQAAGGFMNVFQLPGSKRRFTGSYATGSFTGSFPSVSWLFDYPNPVDPAHWRLVIEGEVELPLALTEEEVISLASERLVATLDCTGGWYSTQEWTGVTVGRFLDMAGIRESVASVTVESVSGYARRFSMKDVRGYLLATHVGGERLSHGHGFPLRLVAPGHRGFNWVKWVARIRVNETSKYWQPPVPLQ